MKSCKKCHEEKPITEFYVGRGICKPCIRIKKNKWRAENPEKARLSVANWRNKPGNREKSRASTQRWIEKHPERMKETQRNGHFRRQYGITLTQYEDMYTDQSGKCAICWEWHETLFVDHNHLTGKVRELLCRPCNSAIAFFKEDQEVILRAAGYISLHQDK